MAAPPAPRCWWEAVVPGRVNPSLPPAPPRIALPFTPLAYWFSACQGRPACVKPEFIPGRKSRCTYTQSSGHSYHQTYSLGPGVIPAGRGWGGTRQKGLDISHGCSECVPQYPVSRLPHRVWGQGASALPTWPCPLRMGGWHEGTGEHGNVRLWRERTGR